MEPRRAAFTLIELLMAIVIGVLLIAVVFSTYRTVTLALEGQRQRDSGTRAVLRAMEVVGADITRAFLPVQDEVCLFRLGEDERDPKSSVVNFCASLPNPQEPDLRFARVRKISYNLGGSDGTSLVRGEQAVSGPGALAASDTQVLASGLRRFRVTLFNGAEWQISWAADPAVIKPLAGRIEMTPMDSTNVWLVEVPIPAGLVITSSITRAASPAGL